MPRARHVLSVVGGVVLVSAAPRAAGAQYQPLAARLAAREDSLERAGRYADAMRVWQALDSVGQGAASIPYAAARLAVRAGDHDAAFRLLREAFERGIVARVTLGADTTLRPLHSSSRWPRLVALADQRAAARDTALRAELLSLAERDQRHREGIGVVVSRHGRNSPQADSAFAAMARGDSAVQARFAAIVRERGWPGRTLVGDDAAHAAWLIAQHADSAAMHRYLPLLRAAVQQGDARAADLAYLEDRVLMTDGQPQLYGTQLTFAAAPGAPATVYRLANPACVDQRRASVGLSPLADYAATVGATYTPPAMPCQP